MHTKLFAVGVALSSLLAGNVRAAETDLEAITTLLLDAKTEAGAINSDAQQLNTFIASPSEWQEHAAKLNEMKAHINKASRIVEDMKNMKEAGSKWQQIAIKRITPALNELANNLQKTIAQLSANQSRVHTSPYRDYAAINAELAANLAETVSDFVQYARTKAKFEDLARRLELPSDQ